MSTPEIPPVTPPADTVPEGEEPAVAPVDTAPIIARLLKAQRELEAAEAVVAAAIDRRHAVIEEARAAGVSLTRIGDLIRVNPAILRHQEKNRAPVAALPGLTIEEAAQRTHHPRTWFTNRLRNNPDGTGVSSATTWQRDGFHFLRFDKEGVALPDGTAGRQGIRTRITELRD